MAFSEKIKLEAKKNSNFQCCVCLVPFVEVHHIIPQEEGGLDILENAAPLCGGCHQKYGGNPELRKQLQQMRDHWWDRCKNQNITPEVFKKIDSLGNNVEEIKEVLIPFVAKSLSQMKNANSVAGLSHTFSALTSGTSLVQFVPICPKCNSFLRHLGGKNYYCEKCNGPLGNVYSF